MLPLLSGRHIQEETFGCYFKNKYIKAIDNIAHRDETYLFSYGRKKIVRLKYLYLVMNKLVHFLDS